MIVFQSKTLSLCRNIKDGKQNKYGIIYNKEY